MLAPHFFRTTTRIYLHTTTTASISEADKLNTINILIIVLFALTTLAAIGTLALTPLIFKTLYSRTPKSMQFIKVTVSKTFFSHLRRSLTNVLLSVFRLSMQKRRYERIIMQFLCWNNLQRTLMSQLRLCKANKTRFCFKCLIVCLHSFFVLYAHINMHTFS